MNLLVVLLLAQFGDAIEAGCPNVGNSTAVKQGCSTNPFFEFAPASGAGMGTSCSCGTPTGSKGEVMTFSRASTGTCMKGNITSGIANGDMVTCNIDEPRVMPGGDGTGVRGLLVERSRTNIVLRNTAMDNIAWTTSGTVTVTADQAVAPDGTTTAERVQFGGANAEIYQNIGGGADMAGSIYVKGVSGSGTIDIALFSGATWQCAACSFVSTSWTRCTLAKPSVTYIAFGEMDTQCGSSRGNQDVYMWGGQLEAGTYATSLIKTAGATVTRSADYAKFASVAGSATAGSFAAYSELTAPSDTAVDQILLAESTGGSYVELLDARLTTSIFTFYMAAGGGASQLSVIPTVGENRWVGYWSGSGSSATACWNSLCTSGSGTPGAFTYLEVGAINGTPAFDGVIKKVCVDPNPGKCQ